MDTSSVGPDSLICLDLLLDSADEALEQRVEAALWELEPSGIERQDDETFSELVEDPSPRPSGAVRLRIYHDGNEDPDALLARYREVLPADVSVAWWRLDDLGFLTAWKEHFKPAQVSDRFWVHPPWEVPDVDGIRLEIDPGMAFGTGTHETTRMCLQAIDRLTSDRTPRSLLDVGTGSGILAIAASKAGVPRVRGVDHDAIAVAVALGNAAANDIEALPLDATPVGDVSGQWDVVVANILPHILEALRDGIVARVAPGGTLVLSGVIESQADALTASYEEAGLIAVGCAQMGDWCAIELRAPGS